MTPEEVLAQKLREYPARPVNPSMPSIPARPDIGKLYEMLSTVQGRPIDYSGLEKVAKARKGASERDFAGGLALSMMGGRELAPHGAALFRQSLQQGEPLRANLADVGYENPETGEFVENPATARSREEKVVTNRIDALIKEQDAQARLAIQQGNAGAADAAKQNSDMLRLILASIAQQNANTNAMLADARADKLRNTSEDANYKPLLTGEVKHLDELVSSYNNMDRLEKSWKPEYAGGVTGTTGSAAENYVARNFPGALGMVMSEKDLNAKKDKAAWWEQQKYYDELPERHKLFGATLTAGESMAWKQASLQPGMQDDQVKKNLAIRKKIMQDATNRIKETYIANRRNPTAVRTLTKSVPSEDGGGWTVEEVK